MVGTVVPMGHGELEEGRAATALWLHATGSLVGAGALAMVMASISALVPTSEAGTTSVLMVGLWAVLLGLRDARLLSFPLPQSHRQVPRRWGRAWSNGAASFAYGVLLGLGVGTYILFGGLYLLLAWALLLPGVGVATALVLFGAARAAPILLLGYRGSVRQRFDFDRLSMRVESFRPAAAVLVSLYLVLVGGVLIGAALKG